MGQIQKGLSKGSYAYSSHSLLLAGDVVDVFIGKWKTRDESEDRMLVKFPPHAEVEGGKLMCILKLRRPIPLDDYKPVHRRPMRPLLKRSDDGEKRDVVMLLIPADMLCVIPDRM